MFSKNSIICATTTVFYVFLMFGCSPAHRYNRLIEDAKDMKNESIRKTFMSKLYTINSLTGERYDDEARYYLERAIKKYKEALAVENIAPELTQFAQKRLGDTHIEVARLYLEMGNNESNFWNSDEKKHTFSEPSRSSRCQKASADYTMAAAHVQMAFKVKGYTRPDTAIVYLFETLGENFRKLCSIERDYLKSDDYQKSVDMYKQVVDILEITENVKSSELARAYILLARSMIESEDLNENLTAFSHLEHAIQLLLTSSYNFAADRDVYCHLESTDDRAYELGWTPFSSPDHDKGARQLNLIRWGLWEIQDKIDKSSIGEKKRQFYRLIEANKAIAEIAQKNADSLGVSDSKDIVADTEGNIGICWMSLNDRTKAIQSFQNEIRLRREIHADDFEQSSLYRKARGVYESVIGRLINDKISEQIIEDQLMVELEVRLGVFGDDDPFVARLHEEIAEFWTRIGRCDKSKSSYEEAVRILSAKSGPSDTEVIRLNQEIENCVSTESAHIDPVKVEDDPYSNLNTPADKSTSEAPESDTLVNNNKEWFVFIDGSITGPYSEKIIAGLVVAGKITTFTAVSKTKTGNDWQTAGKVLPNLFQVSPKHDN